MPGRLNFADVLDEALAAQQDAGGARFWTGPPPTVFFPFHAPRSAPLTSVHIHAHGLVTTESGVSAFANATVDQPNITIRQRSGRQSECRVPNAECRVPARVLTARQQAALDGLVALGARLDADFTTGELRTAFRQLARRYHPDRHHGGSTAEIAQATRVFATMSEHYRSLLAAIA